MNLAAIRRSLRTLAAADLAGDAHGRTAAWFALRALGVPSERLEYLAAVAYRLAVARAARPVVVLAVAA
jgi:hypothetical protein